jgi:hypothetical protein
LDIAQSRLVTIGKEDKKDNNYEKEVDEKRREDLDDGDHTHLEDHFLHKITILQNGIGGIGKTLGKKEPGDDSGDQPEDEGVIVNGRHLETNIKNKPEDKDRDRRLYKGPEKIQVGTQVFGLDVATCQIIDENPAPE